jgi:Tfp pilus assembly protein PilX
MKEIKREGLSHNQSGIVSLIIVSILATVLGLVAVGFSQITNRELKQASDRELNAQAFYAAESGVNDAIAYLQDPAATPLTGCDDWKTAPVGPKYFAVDLSSSSNPAGTAKYTCVITANQTPNLFYQLRAGQSVTIKISQPAMTKLYFGWENQGQKNTGLALPGAFGSLPQESSLTDPRVTGVLRAGMYQVKGNDTSVNNDTLAGESRNYFMYPNTITGSPNSIAFTSGGYSAGPTGTGPISPNGSFVHGNCKTNNTDPNTGSKDTGRFCKSVVTGLGATTYYIQLTALYTNMNVTLWGQSGSGPITFTDTQGEVDVTGKGTDVLQRIRARIDLGRDYQYPDFALQSMKAICKGFEVEVPSVNTYGSNTDNSTMPNPDGSCAEPDNTGGTAPGPAGDYSPH